MCNLILNKHNSESCNGVERTDLFGRRNRYFSVEEIARHNKPDDCWLYAHGKVYNATTFLSHHPAGEQAILQRGGKNSTIDFDFHSSNAQRLWAPYHIGYVEPSMRNTNCIIS